ncbi:MAG: hypothetical protein U9N81_01145 [Bacillota bacterium]|nr:hypothetical protein [Bacillota bacterium]
MNNPPGKNVTIHFANIKEIKDLLKRQQWDEAEELLLYLVENAANKSTTDAHLFQPWYYEQLAGMYQHLENPNAEKVLLEQFASCPYPASAVKNKLLKRLDELQHPDQQSKNNSKRKLFKRDKQEPLPFDSTGAVIDIAATGFTGKKEEIIELSVLLFTFDKETGQVQETIGEYTGLCEPSVPIKPAARKVHGITAKEVQGQTLDIALIYELLQKAEFIITHNANFKQGLIEKLLPYTQTKQWFCSMNGIDWLIKGSNKDLHELLSERGLETTPPYRSTEESRGILRLLSCKGYNDIPYMYELLKIKPAIDTSKKQKAYESQDESSKKRKQKSRPGYFAGIITMLLIVIILYMIFIR